MNANYIFKSKIQVILKYVKEEEFKREYENPKFIRYLNELHEYVKSGGELTDSYNVLSEFFSQLLFEEESENEDEFPNIIKTEEFLYSVIDSEKLDVKEAKKYFHFNFTENLLSLFHKRCSFFFKQQTKLRWKQILHKFYYKFFDFRKFIYESSVSFLDSIAVKSSKEYSLFSQINKKCKTDEEEKKMIEPYHVIGELLEIFGAIIAGFNTPIDQTHLQLLLPTLLRLHRNTISIDDLTTTIQLYHKQLSFCISQFIEKSKPAQQQQSKTDDDVNNSNNNGSATTSLISQNKTENWGSEHNLMISILRSLVETINFFSKVGSSKQAVYILNEVEQIMESMNVTSFRSFKTLFFQLENNCFSDLNFTIAQRSMLLFKNPKIFQLSIEHRDVFFDTKIIPSLFKCAKEHWNETSRQMSFQLLSRINDHSTESKKLTNNFDFKQLCAQWIAEEKETKKKERIKQKNMKKKKEKVLTILDFVYVKELGVGSYSQVHHVRFIDHSVSQLYWEDYALKSMIKSHIKTQHYFENIKREKEILSSFFGHPLIVRLIGEFEDNEKYFLLLEYAENGDLFHLIEKFGTFNFEFVQFVISEVCLALQFLHSKNIVYADLKPENILSFPSGHIKLTDFASSQFVDSSSSINDFSSDDSQPLITGTREYLSPHILRGVRKTVHFFDDIWALGCLVYQLCIGTLPFNGTTNDQILTKIESPLIYPSTVPHQAKELIEFIFSHKDDENLTIEDVKQHSFFDGVIWSEVLSSKPPAVATGEVKVSESDINLRQRKYSMMLTQSLPSSYSYASFSLSPIPEDDPFASNEEDMEI